MPVRIAPAAAILPLFTLFSMKGHELQIFEILMKKPMTIKQLQKASHMSERMLRTYLDDLTERNFVFKKVVEDKRLKYVYYAHSPESIMQAAKDMIISVEKTRRKMARSIVKGSEHSTEWRG
ncbi:MAG: hypothetical protein HYY37_05835 [Candidatus Aenigmarchaeota archaeon]|nr:hypothetical protein [Candidatus Aenigmarchaeota archaeon]